MQIISKDQFGELLDSLFEHDKEVVELMPEVGVNVIALSAAAAVGLSEETKDDEGNAMYAWVAACCVDDEYNKVFTTEEVGKLPSAMFRKLSDAVIKVNGLLSNTSVEEAEKNSEEAES